MQAQDAPTLFLIKFWPWVIANTKQLIATGVAIVVVVFGIVFYSNHQTQREVDAGEALSHALFENRGADVLLKVASDYPGTRAGQRALLEGAQALFNVSRYADALTQFQNFLNAYPDSELVPNANLGVAASLEAQGQLDKAAGSYQKVVNQSAVGVAMNAKFGLARIYQLQGKTADAEKIYEDIVKQSQNSPYAQEAAMRAVELKTGVNATAAVQSSAAGKTNSPAPSFQLTH